MSKAAVPLLVGLLWVQPAPLLAFELPECTADFSIGEECITPVEELHPTQFAVGLRAVGEQQEKIESMGKKERHRYLEKNPVPVVIGPRGALYAIDRHHLSRAVLEAGHSKLVARIERDWRHLSKAGFWARMQRADFVYLYDERGRGPLSPSQLPARMADLQDDPYRSLAGSAREEGCFTKTSKPFAEFHWAQYFRTRVRFRNGSQRAYRSALGQALKLCHLPEARDLPGYTSE